MKTAFLLILVFSSWPTYMHGQSPTEALTKAGLQQFEKAWLLPEEFEFRQRLPELEKKAKQMQDLLNSVDKETQSVKFAKDKAAKREAAFLAKVNAQKNQTAGSTQAIQLDKEIKQQGAALLQLRQQIPPPEQWGLQMPLKKQLWDCVALPCGINPKRCRASPERIAIDKKLCSTQ